MKERIIEIIKSVNEDLVTDMDMDLLASGKLDSFDIISIITEIEDTFDVEVDMEQIKADNFRTANIMADFFERVIEG